MILIFGRDRTLLETRQWILSRQGYKICVASDLSEVQRGLSDGLVRLLILCYTLTERECAGAIALARTRPEIQSLRLGNGNYTEDGASEGAAEVLNIFDGPAKLVSTVDKLLHSATKSKPDDFSSPTPERQ